MATKLAVAKADVKNLVTAKSAPVKPAAPMASDVPKASKVRRFNATTIKALHDAKLRRNLTSCVDEDDLFRKLGVKIGKAKV
jgi:hypothetical protein